MSSTPKNTGMAATIQPFFCGGISAMTASAIVHPIDLAKVRIQMYAIRHPGEVPPSFFGILRNLAKKDGVTAIYSGVSASLLRQAIYGTARLGLFRKFSDEAKIMNDGQPISFVCLTKLSICILSINYLFIKQLIYIYI
jgi:hypothetical protein